MRIHGDPWGPMEIHEDPWRSMRIHADPRICFFPLVTSASFYVEDNVFLTIQIVSLTINSHDFFNLPDFVDGISLLFKSET